MHACVAFNKDHAIIPEASQESHVRKTATGKKEHAQSNSL